MNNAFRVPLRASGGMPEYRQQTAGPEAGANVAARYDDSAGRIVSAQAMRNAQADAQNWEKFNRGLQTFLYSGNKLYHEYRDRTSRAYVDEALMQAREEMNAWRNEYDETHKGQNGLQAAADYQKQWAKIIETHMQGLREKGVSGPYEQLANLHLRENGVHFENQGIQYQRQQDKAFTDNQLKVMEAQLLEEAQRNPDNWQYQGLLLGQYEGMLQRHRPGLDVSVAVRDMQTKMFRSALDSCLTAGDMNGAMRLYNQGSSAMTPLQRNQVVNGILGGFEKYIEAFGVNGDMAGMDRAIAEAKAFAKRNAGGGYQGYGSISIKHESSGDPGAVSPDSFNSHSYGLFQFNSGKNDSGGTIHGFVNMLQARPEYQGMYQGLSGKRIGSAEFNSAFKKVSSENRQLMEQAQREYLHQKYVEPAKQVLMSEPGTAEMLQRFDGNPAFEEMLVSTAVGHGPGKTGGKEGAIAVFRNAWNSLSPWLQKGDDDKVLLDALVNAVYDDRPHRYGSSSAKTQAAMAARYKEEKEEVRALVGEKKDAPAGGENMRLTLYYSKLDKMRQTAMEKNEREVLKDYPDMAGKLKFGDTSEALKAADDLEARGLPEKAKELREAAGVIEGTKTERQWAAQTSLPFLQARIRELEKQADPDFPAMPNTSLTKSEGLLEQGNIDLHKRQKVQLEDGSTATVRSISANIDGKEVLLPTISQDGRVMTEDEAIAEYKRTGQHLGKFDTPEHATAYATALHKNQEAEYLGGRKKELVEHQRANAELKAAKEVYEARVKAYKNDPAAASLSDEGLVLPGNATTEDKARTMLDMQARNGVPEGNRRILTKEQIENFKAEWTKADPQKKTAFLLGDGGIMKSYGSYAGKVMQEMGLTPMDSLLSNVLISDPGKVNAVRRLWEEYGAPKEKVPDIEKDDTVNNLWVTVRNNSKLFEAVSAQAQATNSREAWALAMDISTVARKMLKKGVPADDVKDALDMGCTFSVDDDRAIFLPGKVSEDNVDDAIRIFGDAAIKKGAAADAYGLKAEDVFKKMKSNGIWVNAPDGDGVVLVDKIAQAPFKNADGSFIRISQYYLVNGKDAAEDQYAHAEED